MVIGQFNIATATIGDPVEDAERISKGVIKQHRTIGTTLNTLIRCGFAISRVEEWGPTDDQISI